jgi:hypothetical protein
MTSQHALQHCITAICAAPGADEWAPAAAGTVEGCVKLKSPALQQELQQQIIKVLAAVSGMQRLHTPRLTHVGLQDSSRKGRTEKQEEDRADDTAGVSSDTNDIRCIKE